MVKKILLVCVIGLFLSRTPQTHTIYLPIIQQPAPQGKSGIAWNKAGYNDVSDFGFSRYHVWTIDGMSQEEVSPERWENIKGLVNEPYFSCPVRPYSAMNSDEPVQEDLVEQLQILATTSYDGIVYFLNEPNHPGQCTMSPTEAAQMYSEVVTICPRCKFTMPNVSDWDYLANWSWTREYLGIMQAIHAPQPIYGAFHTYKYPVTPMVDSYLLLLSEYQLDVNVVITEYGNCDPQTAVAMHNDLLSDDRVERMFWFTATGYGCTDLFIGTGDNSLTELGSYFRLNINRSNNVLR